MHTSRLCFDHDTNGICVYTIGCDFGLRKDFLDAGYGRVAFLASSVSVAWLLRFVMRNSSGRGIS
jgi:hypothetical protein